MGSLEEGVEEGVAEYLDPYIQRSTYNPEAKNASKEDILAAGALGMATAGILKGGAAALMLPRASANAANSLRNPQGDHAADTALHGAPMSERIAQQERLRAANTPVGAETAPQTEQITAQNTQNAQNQAGMEIIQDAIIILFRAIRVNRRRITQPIIWNSRCKMEMMCRIVTERRICSGQRWK